MPKVPQRQPSPGERAHAKRLQAYAHANKALPATRGARHTIIAPSVGQYGEVRQIEAQPSRYHKH